MESTQIEQPASNGATIMELSEVAEALNVRLIELYRIIRKARAAGSLPSVKRNERRQVLDAEEAAIFINRYLERRGVKAPPPADAVTWAQIAKALGVTRKQLYPYRRKFPPPDGVMPNPSGRGRPLPWWHRATVEAFITQQQGRARRWPCPTCGHYVTATVANMATDKAFCPRCKTTPLEAFLAYEDFEMVPAQGETPPLGAEPGALRTY